MGQVKAPVAVSEVKPASETTDYLTSMTALTLLRVKPQTLYAYVSRGWIRSIRDRSGGRSLYSRLDVERVKARADARAGHAAVAAAAMRWGEPIMQTAITAITPHGPSYRGEPAVGLVALGCSFETVADRLWCPRNPGAGEAWRPDPEVLRRMETIATSPLIDHTGDPVRFLAMIASLSRGQGSDWSRDSPSLISEARTLLHLLAASLRHRSGARQKRQLAGGSIAERILIAQGGVRSDAAIAALNAGLVLCADHELSQTTFVARIAASAGADLGSCISAAILSQPRLAARRSPACTEAFLNRLVETGDVRRTFEAACESGRDLPGFNHPLYPDGDPRGRAMIDIVRRLPQSTRKSAAIMRIFEMAASEFKFYPSFDAGLMGIAAALDLRAGAASELYIIARSAGWTAHVFEQWQTGSPLRPRAKYVGEPVLPEAHPRDAFLRGDGRRSNAAAPAS